MKVRWREHEAVLITLITSIIIAGYISDMHSLAPAQMAVYAGRFIQAHISFNYYTRVLLPQIGIALLLLVCYLNLAAIRLFVPKEKRIGAVLLSVSKVLVIAYVAGPVINFLSFYINPYYNGRFSYLPLTFGYHPQPFFNVFGGLGMALFLAFVYIAYLFFREVTINYFEKLSTRKAYYILVLNQTTLTLVVFILIPIFASTFKLVTESSYYSGYFAIGLPVLAVFITNTYWLYPQKDERSFFNWHFLGPLLFFSFIYALFFSMSFGSGWSIGMVLFSWTVQLAFTSPVSWYSYQQRKDKLLQLRGAEKALVKSKADLQFLRSQINPHFLFNALNTLYGTALIEGSEKTAEGIQKLGDMMRFMLHENNMDFIAMDKEIAYLKNYISLQKLRTQSSPDIMIEDNITDSTCSHKIAPMLLIPFVENAFKHGISMAERSWIAIKLECDDQDISFEVRNSVHEQKTNDPEENHSGIGLQNVQERLRILYPGRYEFKYGIEDDGYVVKLMIKPMQLSQVSERV